MQASWRWFGKDDPITLQEIKEAGAQGVVTALHDIACGEIWPLEAIKNVKKQIKTAGLSWNIVESLPIHEDIKQNKPSSQKYIKTYIQSMENLAQAGIKVICYNFMPVIDWTRTALFEPQSDGSLTLSFNYIHYIAYDLFLLRRKQAQNAYSSEQKQEATQFFNSLTEQKKQQLTDIIGLGLPGTVDDLSIKEIRRKIDDYQGITNINLRQNLIIFLKQIIPHAEKLGLKMAIHPDDPPLPLFGLPRIISSYDDISTLFQAIPSMSNGLTLCTGSLGAGLHNDVPQITKDFSDRIYFAHLRSVKHRSNNFIEAPHLEGTPNLREIIQILLEEEKRRSSLSIKNKEITFRPDHANLMLTDKKLPHNHYYPGYSLIGRMKALAELKGIIYGMTCML